MKFYLPLLGLTAIPFVSAHCKITAAKGDLGGSGVGLGVTSVTADNADNKKDVTRFDGVQKETFGRIPAVRSVFPNCTMCGHADESQGGGPLNPLVAMPQALKITNNELPQVSPGGTLTMTLHQINGDGAGPMKCSIDSSATGDFSKQLEITTNVPGEGGKSNQKRTDHTLVVKMPEGVQCTGAIGEKTSLCFVRCENPAPFLFGGILPIQMGKAGQTAVNNNANAVGSEDANKSGETKQEGPADTTGKTVQDGNEEGDGESEQNNNVSQNQSPEAAPAADATEKPCSKSQTTVELGPTPAADASAKNAGAPVYVRSLLRG